LRCTCLLPASVEVEHFAEKGFLAARVTVASFRIAVAMIVIATVPVAIASVLMRLLRFLQRQLLVALNETIEFTAIEPHAAALLAIVDFDAFASGHQQVCRGADRAFHVDSFRFAFDEDNLAEASTP